MRAFTLAGVIAVTSFVPVVDSDVVAMRILPAVLSVASAIDAEPPPWNGLEPILMFAPYALKPA